MINSLKGAVLDFDEQSMTIEVAGIGFQVYCSQAVPRIKNEPISLFIHLQWHQENGPLLFGFQSELEKTVFLTIISCSGIGPKIALALLSAMTPTVFLMAIQNGNEKALSSISGIGAKKAEQMIVQLKHKVAKLLDKGVTLDNDSNLEHWQNLSEVLTSLHYTRTEVNNALHLVRESAPQNAPFDQLLRKALSVLSKRI